MGNLVKFASSTINQPSANPTNKLTAATIATAATSVFGLVLKNLWPAWYDPETLMAVLPIVTYVAGWYTKDAPNIVVVQEGQSGLDT